jgi:anti-sigma factor RsiW
MFFVFAVDRALLGQMSDADRNDYEAHLFECPVCAHEIVLAFDFIETLRAVLASSVVRSRRSCRLRLLREPDLVKLAEIRWGNFV